MEQLNMICRRAVGATQLNVIVGKTPKCAFLCAKCKNYEFPDVIKKLRKDFLGKRKEALK